VREKMADTSNPIEPRGICALIDKLGAENSRNTSDGQGPRSQEDPFEVSGHRSSSAPAPPPLPELRWKQCDMDMTHAMQKKLATQLSILRSFQAHEKSGVKLNNDLPAGPPWTTLTSTGFERHCIEPRSLFGGMPTTTATAMATELGLLPPPVHSGAGALGDVGGNAILYDPMPSHPIENNQYQPFGWNSSLSGASNGEWRNCYVRDVAAIERSKERNRRVSSSKIPATSLQK